MGFNPQSEYYFIRGSHHIKRIEEIAGSRKACRMPVYQKEVWSNKKKFQAFVVGALIGHLSQYSKWKDNLEKLRVARSGIYKGLPNHNRATRFSGFYPVAADGIFQIYGIPLSTASDYKRLAQKHGYIKVKKSYQKLPITIEEVSFYKKSIPCEEAKKIRIRINKKSKAKTVVKQEPDLVLPCLEYTKKYRQKDKS